VYERDADIGLLYSFSTHGGLSRYTLMCVIIRRLAA